jgi:succinyl-diaminopimelate desuccinylase
MNALRLTEALIARRSVTPEDGGCQALLGERLQAAGFFCETHVFGPADFRVTNLFALRQGSRVGPTLAFAGHTDVVPTPSCPATVTGTCMAAARRT